MNDERVVEEIVTEFLFNKSCRLRPKLTMYAVYAALHCGWTVTVQTEADFIPLTTGSVAEFYIEPMIPHIGDVDVMYHRSTELAIPAGHPPPTQLPDEFHNYVEVYEIVDSHLPGYVYLESRYLLTECPEKREYSAVEIDERFVLPNVTFGDNPLERHGPAIITDVGHLCDHVFCVRCLVWPPQAVDWPSRHRNYDWPDSATVDRVVSNGCDVVGVAHHQCRQDEWVSKHQHRLSFSRAEIVLLNSWTPVQQIVYHVLRDYMKTERLTDSADNSGARKLSNYHIKTLMLWACEIKSKSWWTEDVNLVRICVELLHDLAVWLTEARCPQYFINNCNLVDDSFDLETIASQLKSINKSCLSRWFVNNYIQRCAQLCPDRISRLFHDVSKLTTVELQSAVSAICDWRINTSMYDLWEIAHSAEDHIMTVVSLRSLNAQFVDCFFSSFNKIYISEYFIAVALLHVAYKISQNDFNNDMMDCLHTIIIRQPIGPRRYSSWRSSELLLSKAANLMKAVDDRSKSRSTVHLIAIELYRAYLYRALTCEDSDSDSIYCLAIVYLAVLYYTTGQYQTAIDHCTPVTRSQDHSQLQLTCCTRRTSTQD